EGECSRCCVVGDVPGLRHRTVTLPETGEQESKVGMVEGEDRGRQVFRASTEPPETELLEPYNRARRTGAISTTDVNAVAISVASHRGHRVGELLNASDKLLTMLRARRGEVRRAGVAEVTFSNQVGQDDDLVARPPHAARTRQSASGGDAIAYAQGGQRAPPPHGQHWMLGRGHDLAAECRTEVIDHPGAAGRGLYDPSPDKPHVLVTCEGRLDPRAPMNDVFDGHSLARVGIEDSRLTDDALGKPVEGEGRDGVDD